MRTILEGVAKDAGDRAAQAVVAEYKPKLDAAELEKWTWAGAALILGAAIIESTNLLQKR